MALDAGDSLAAARWALRLEDSVENRSRLRSALALSLRGAIAARGGATTQAVTLLDSALARQPVDHSMMSVFVAQPAERYDLARWLIDAGRAEEAEAWLRSLGEGSIYDLAYQGPASLLLGRLLETRGDRAGARSAYERVALLYRHADPPFQPWVSEATERARALSF
jgi:hypothetical protein